MNTPYFIKLNDLTVAYNRIPAVHHINAIFIQGSLTAITGANGAGKSTLLKAIAEILPVFEGSIDFNNISRSDMAYLPQSSDLQIDFPISILQMVTSGFWHEVGGFQKITKEQKEKARNALALVGLLGFENHTLDSVSVGQFQRALFARIIVQDAKIILLDEPFTAIDSTTTDALLNLIKKWHQEGRTIICVLHDFEQIKANFNDCLLMSRDVIAFGKSSDVLKS
jgi:zinc/manganese transport system ATP-binding protein